VISGLCLLWLPAPAISGKPEIKWYSYQEGMKKVKEENKKGFLHFYTNWCHFCKLMNANTFSDAKVATYINENFVPMRVNAEDQKDIAKQYNVDRFPFTFFIAEDDSTIGNRPGYIPADVLLDMLAYVNTNSYKTMTFSDYMQQKQAKKKESPPHDPNM